MIVTCLHHGPHKGRIFTEPFSFFKNRIAFADPPYSLYADPLDHSSGASHIL
jgi:hypothetical protein